MRQEGWNSHPNTFDFDPDVLASSRHAFAFPGALDAWVWCRPQPGPVGFQPRLELWAAGAAADAPAVCSPWSVLFLRTYLRGQVVFPVVQTPVCATCRGPVPRRLAASPGT